MIIAEQRKLAIEDNFRDIVAHAWVQLQLDPKDTKDRVAEERGKSIIIIQKNSNYYYSS